MGALSEKNPRLLLWPRLLAGLAAQLGVVVLFPVFGPTAATFTALACAGAILLVGSALNVNRVLVAPIKWRKISLSIASSTILLILLALLSMLLKSGIVQAFAAIVGGVVSLGIAEYVIIRNRSGEVNNSPRNSS